MGGEGRWDMVLPPTVAPLNPLRHQEHWKHFDDSVNAVSFGFVATAILISMFLLLALFERFLRQTSAPESGAPTAPLDLEHQMVFGGKVLHPSPKVTSSYLHPLPVLSFTPYGHCQILTFPSLSWYAKYAVAANFTML